METTLTRAGLLEKKISEWGFQVVEVDVPPGYRVESGRFRAFLSLSHDHFDDDFRMQGRVVDEPPSADPNIVNGDIPDHGCRL